MPLVELLGRLDSGLGGQLAAFEALWGNYYDYNTAPPAQNARRWRAARRSTPSRRRSAEIRSTIARGSRACSAQALEDGLLTDVTIASSETERRAIWAIREDVWQVQEHRAAAHLRREPAHREHEGVRGGSVRRRAARSLARTARFVFGHMADGNLHLVIAAGDDAATRARIEGMVYRPLAAIGGSVSAEHGIGLEKRAYLPLSRTAAEISTMRLLKNALDPKGILNPGKVFA